MSRIGNNKRGKPTTKDREKIQFETGVPILDEFLKLVWQHGVSAVADETGICSSTIGGWVEGRTVPPLVKAQKVLNTIGYELVIFEIDEPFEEE